MSAPPRASSRRSDCCSYCSCSAPAASSRRISPRARRRPAAASERGRGMDDYVISVLANIGMFSFIALSAYLLLLTGEISFGQQAFFAIGAYASGIATALWGLPFALALLIGAVAGGIA